MNEIPMTSTETVDRTLFEKLQKEFCPTLDPSLIAALLFDVESDFDGVPVNPTSYQIESLRATLKELSVQADESSEIEYSSDIDNTLQEPISSWTTPSSFGPAIDNEGDFFTEDSQMSGSSSSSSTSFSSPLGFLQMVLPDVPSAKLRNALDIHDGEDIWDVIAFVVNEEAIRETEERGLEGSEDDETGWEIVQTKKKEPGMMKASKKKTPIKPKKFVLADIRQQHHDQDKEPQSSRRRNGSIPGLSSSQSAPSTMDFWTWISSVSSRLASLLPPHSPTTFSSFLHSPRYATSYDAVRACLKSLCKSNDLSDRQATLLINLLDIIVPQDEEVDIEMRSQIISDVELAVCVTDGQGDSALDLAYLLRDLDGPGMGLKSSHFSRGLSSSLPTGVVGVSGSKPSLPTRPQDVPPLSSSLRKAHPPSKRSSLKINTHQWQTVPSRTKPTHRVPRNLPASKGEVNGNSRVRMQQAMTKSRQALMNAAIMYQKHNSKHRGEVAFFYAERAREWKQIAKREALNAAREMVLTKRKGNRDVIDLHGTTIAEALAIVKEILNQRADSISSGKPLSIVTGKGNHSAGRVSVLKPALRSALTEDGWIVTTWDAGLVVRGRV